MPGVQSLHIVRGFASWQNQMIQILMQLVFNNFDSSNVLKLIKARVALEPILFV